MFYAISGKKKVPITSRTTYAQCPRCGRYHQIDLQDILETGGSLTDTRVFCHFCSIERARQNRGEPWADMILAEEE